MSETSRGKVRHELDLRLEPKVESLTAYIASRFAILSQNPKALPQRSVITSTAYKASIALSTASGWMDMGGLEVAHKGHRKAFLALQELYITHHADGIVVTAAISMAKMLRGFRPE